MVEEVYIHTHVSQGSRLHKVYPTPPWQGLDKHTFIKKETHKTSISSGSTHLLTYLE